MKNNVLEAFFKSYSDTEELIDFRMAHENLGVKLPVISTGSLVLDDALSSGGNPKGRIIQYYGPPGSGKTLMAMLAMVEAQKDDPTAQQLFIDAEQTFSPSWAEALGLDLNKVAVIDGESAANGRRCFEMLLGVPKEDAKHVLIGKKQEGFLDKIVNKELNFNMIVLDSLGSIIPVGEDVSQIGKQNISLLARFLSTTMKKLSLEVKKANIPFIVVNHKKSSMDPYGPDHTFSGGNAYGHFLSANVYFEAVQRKDAQILDEKENKVGHIMRASIEKSKFGPWPRKCEFKVNFGIGVTDIHEEIAKLALDYDIVAKPTTVTHTFKDQKWTGFNKFCDAIKESKELAEELTKLISETRDNKIAQKRVEREEKNKLLNVAAEESNGKKRRKNADA